MQTAQIADTSTLSGILWIAGAFTLPAAVAPGDNDRGDNPMKAIVVTERAAGTGGMKLVDRPEPQASINDVVVRVHASGFVPTELTWPSTWTDRLERDRTPSIPGHELAGVVPLSDMALRGCR